MNTYTLYICDCSQFWYLCSSSPTAGQYNSSDLPFVCVTASEFPGCSAFTLISPWLAEAACSIFAAHGKDSGGTVCGIDG